MAQLVLLVTDTRITQGHVHEIFFPWNQMFDILITIWFWHLKSSTTARGFICSSKRAWHHNLALSIWKYELGEMCRQFFNFLPHLLPVFFYTYSDNQPDIVLDKAKVKRHHGNWQGAKNLHSVDYTKHFKGEFMNHFTYYTWLMSFLQLNLDFFFFSLFPIISSYYITYHFYIVFSLFFLFFFPILWYIHPQWGGKLFFFLSHIYKKELNIFL